MGRVDAEGIEWLDLRDPVDGAKWDAMTADMVPHPLSYFDEIRAARRAERDQLTAGNSAIETAVQ